jgi:hypothetical protein
MRSALVFAACFASLAALPAAANPGHGHHGHHGHQGPSLLNATALTAEATPAGVHVHMELDRYELERVRRRGLDPGLAIDLGGRTEVIKLTRVTDVQLNTRRPPAYIKVNVVDRSLYARHDAIALTLGGILVDSVRLPVVRVHRDAPPPPPRPTAWSEHPAVIDACRSAMPYGQRRACELAVDGARDNPSALVLTCDRSFVGADDTLACIRVGLTARTAIVPLIQACDRAFVGSTDTLSCLRTTAAASRSLVSDLDACDRALVGSADTLTCLGHAAAATASMQAVIKQCDMTFVSQADELACMQHASTAPSMGAARDIVAQCDAHRSSDRDEMRCVERRLGERVAHRGDRGRHGR